jgi:hypothetical protein
LNGALDIFSHFEAVNETLTAVHRKPTNNCFSFLTEAALTRRLQELRYSDDGQRETEAIWTACQEVRKVKPNGLNGRAIGRVGAKRPGQRFVSRATAPQAKGVGIVGKAEGAGGPLACPLFLVNISNDWY